MYGIAWMNVETGACGVETDYRYGTLKEAKEAVDWYGDAGYAYWAVKLKQGVLKMKIEIKCSCGASFSVDTVTMNIYTVVGYQDAILLTAREFIEAHKGCCTATEE